MCHAAPHSCSHLPPCLRCCHPLVSLSEWAPVHCFYLTSLLALIASTPHCFHQPKAWPVSQSFTDNTCEWPKDHKLTMNCCMYENGPDFPQDRNLVWK